MFSIKLCLWLELWFEVLKYVPYFLPVRFVSLKEGDMSTIDEPADFLFGGTSDCGLSQIRTQYNIPLYKGHSLRSQNNPPPPIVLVHFAPPKEDNLLTKSKWSCHKVSFIWRYHYICAPIVSVVLRKDSAAVKP